MAFETDIARRNETGSEVHGGGAAGKSTLTQRLARRARGDASVDAGAEAAVERAGSGGGAPLRDDLRARFEGSLGADLSGVRVHTGDESARASEAVGAKAYAVGNDVHFGAGQYQPDDPFGVHLLAHEVAHTQQQSAGSAHRQNRLEVSEPGDAAEVEADRAADAMVAGRPASVSGAGPQLARQAGGKPTVQVGSSGPMVVELQQKVGVEADGQFGPKTRAAVVAFQQAHGLAADGVVGPKTWAALDGAPAQPAAGGANAGGANAGGANAGANAGGANAGGANAGGAAPAPAGAKPPVPGDPIPGSELKPPSPDDPDDGGAPDAEGKTPGQRYREEYVAQLLAFEGAVEGGKDGRFDGMFSPAGLEAGRKAAGAQGRVLTTCNSFSGILQTRVEQKTGVKLKTKINLYVMDPKWREKNLPPGCFHKGEAGMTDRPRPGDIMILSKLDGVTFQHMSNIAADPKPQPDGSEIWEGIDGGQGVAGKYDVDGNLIQKGQEMIGRVTYNYNPATGTMKNKYGNERKVYGWIDIEALANG